ncbi:MULTISPECIES: hypothetical protein [unclassified Shewanella]|uniref:hypothetical protein n=1 Tax=unclassified Shewanella TaxID=196818 RepID=UPI0022BA436C|nr:hypothetical protein [Shewanella sp. MTB7]MEC4738733.1 hypothetical protein [Shewanella sp. E94]WBJ98325.1 hypothetical protein HWQ47_24885 [Shewanella sp. MTB7]
MSTAVTGGGLAFSPQGAPAATCHFVYMEATSTSVPTYTLYTPATAQDPFVC